MQEPGNDIDLFSPRLTNEGIRNIRRFSIAAMWVLILGSITALSYFVFGLLRIFNNKLDYSTLDSSYKIYLESYPFINFIYGLLFVFQLYFYIKIKRLLSESMKNKNEPLFNRAFDALFKNAVFGAMSLGFGLIVTLVEIFFC